MNDVIDLTTKAGIKTAEAILNQVTELTKDVDGKTVALATVGLATLAAGIYVVSKFSTPPSVDQQAQAAWNIIERARQSGAKFVKVRVSEDTLADLKSKLKDFFDVKGSRNGTVEVEVHFA
jgi:hypothetical protein